MLDTFNINFVNFKKKNFFNFWFWFGTSMEGSHGTTWGCAVFIIKSLSLLVFFCRPHLRQIFLPLKVFF